MLFAGIHLQVEGIGLTFFFNASTGGGIGMVTCAQCGSENVEGAKYCTSCGSSLALPDAAPGALTPPGSSLQPQQPAQPIMDPLYQQQPPYSQTPQQYVQHYHTPVQVVAGISNSKATWSFISGLVGIFLCPIIFSVIAIALGYIARNEIAATGGVQKGDGLALAGIILGFAGIVLGIIWIIVFQITYASSAVFI